MPLSLFLTSFPTPCQHHPFLPPLLPTIAERQSTERSQFEHASLRITKGLSVRRFHPRRRFLFSFLRAPSGLTLSPFLFLFLSLVFSLFFLLSLFLSSYPCILLSFVFSRSFRTIDVSSHHRASLDLPSKWIRHAPVRLTHCTAVAASSFVVPFTFSRSRKRRNGMALWQTRESRPRTG